MKTPFNKSPTHDKWNKYQTLKGKWYCPNCRTQLDKPERANPFHGASVHCGNCDHELTRRTGGGQSDPFNWYYGKPPKPQIPNIETQLRQALIDHLGPKTTPRKTKTGQVTSGATYQTPLKEVAKKTNTNVAQLSRFLHNKGTLSLASATRLAQYLELQLRK